MNGVVIVSVMTGACLYSKLYGCDFGLTGRKTPAQRSRACAALDNTEAEDDATPRHKCVLKTIRLGKHVMHFAADSRAGVMACVSLTQPLHASVAVAYVEKVLKSFVDKHGHQIVNGSLVGRVQGFSTCLQSIHEGLPQQIVSDMADAVRPMALPWVLMAPTSSLLQPEQASVLASKRLSCFGRATVLPAAHAPSYKFIWSDTAQTLPNHNSPECTLPGTSHTVAEVVKMVGCASRQLACSASDSSSPSQHLPTYLQSLDVPLSSPRTEPAVIAVADAGANTLCTPRMIEILPKEGVLGGASQPTEADIANKNVKNRLLVLYHKSLVVAIPVQLAAHTYTSAIQAKNAVNHHVSQLFAFTELDWLQTSV